MLNLYNKNNMKVSENILLKINKLSKGYIFTYSDFISEENRTEAVIKALNRLVKSGKIAKLSKGKYYKPENTPFGLLKPNQREIVKDLLEDDGKVIGYITGYSIYSQLGLTTQISNTIQIGRNKVRPSFKREWYKISFIKQNNIITKSNIPLLQILDSIKYIKKIPDSRSDFLCKRFLAILQSLSKEDKSILVKLALKYPPATKALLGAFLDQLEQTEFTEQLYKSLNPVSKYKITGVAKVLPTSVKWHIV